jgi:7-cyano-7-deazaguanine synthase
VATSWAEVIGATKIFIGAVWEDSSGYPDCRPEYYDAMNQVIRAGTRPSTKITIEAPLICLTKSDIVKRGIELAAPLELTWSCYRDSDAACGICDSCALRLRAFQEAGVKDPILYAAKPEYARV